MISVERRIFEKSWPQAVFKENVAWGIFLLIVPLETELSYKSSQ